MHLAAIVPLSCLHMVKEYKYHLVEAYWLQKYPKYYEFFEEMSKLDGKYLMLDNSEGIQHRIDDEVLLEYADKLNVQEVIMPDVNPVKSKDKKGAAKTLEASQGFKDKVKGSKFKLMGVAHGCNLEEVCKLLRFFKDDTVGFPSSAAIPREFLMRYCNIPKERRHMLGAKSYAEIVRCKELARSVDTNLPVRAAASSSFIFTFKDSNTRIPFDMNMSIVPVGRVESYLRYLSKAISEE